LMAFTIYPAIDIRGGRCVRLTQGDYGRETVYYDDPVEAALEWVRQGATWLHVVDLDGAKEGRPVHAELIARIAAEAGVPVQAGGGVRTEADIERMLKGGVARVVLGTKAIEDPDLVRRAVSSYGDRVAVGLDARDGNVAVRGWLETTGARAEDVAKELADCGVAVFVVTDIGRDGTMKGPNVEAAVRVARASGRPVVASGGVADLADLIRLKERERDGVVGVIVGKALYAGAFTLREALAALDRAAND